MVDEAERTVGPEEPVTADVIQGGNPFVGLTPRQVLAAAGRYAGAMTRRPSAVAARGLELSAEELRILVGLSRLAPDPKDKRFADPAWSHPVWRRLAQSYLAARDTLLSSVDDAQLDEKSAERARFALMQLTEMAAPTNNLLGNPAAIKKALRTRGRSLRDGRRHLVHDVLRNGGMPSQVDTRPFVVGETIAVTPGSVVYRSEMFELLQYDPTTSRVRERPTLVIPPQVNRYYFLDLAPGRSFAEYMVSRGIQAFMISWRNPKPVHRDWGLDAYASACLEAIDVVREITGSDDVNATGFCAGGMTEAALLSHLVAEDNPVVHAATFAVTMFDTDVRSTLNAFASKRAVETAIRKSKRKGVLDGRSIARVFAWVRPNDLVWNYWVSNYLLGLNPPAFDVLAWNADSTNLPAALHRDFLGMWMDNGLLNPGRSMVFGRPIDLMTVKSDVYVVGAMTDHLVPWQSAYAATQAFGGEVRFVLSNSGHIQALINPPDNPKASFFTAEVNPASAKDWLDGASRSTGSWWVDWADWTIARSGEERQPPRQPGSATHPPLEKAPGRYAVESH